MLYTTELHGFNSEVTPYVIEYLAHDESNSSSSTYNHTSFTTSEANVSRFMLCGVTWRQSGGARSISSVICNSVSLSPIVYLGSADAGAAIYGAYVPSGTGTPTVDVTFNNTVQRSAAVLIGITGELDVLNPFDTATVATTGSGAFNTTINIPQNGFCFGVCHWNNDSSSMTWSGLDELQDDSYGGAAIQRFSSAMQVNMNDQTGRTITVTPTGSSNIRRLAVVSFGLK